jgi:hypothetical protein
MTAIIKAIHKSRLILALLAVLQACAADGGEVDEATEPEPAPELETSEQAVINCAARTDTGYSGGKPFTITVIEVDGYPVERETANHYVAMQRAAQAAGIGLRINSGFRTMAKQQYLYNCYRNCTSGCESCNLAATPGTSNHQSGKALDLNTSAAGVMSWLNANAARFGFKRTVAEEAWHWEWLGGGESVDACGGSVGGDGCTDTERANAGKFGCVCVDHQPSGGYCPGSGCTELETDNCGAFGTACVDHKCSGGFTDGTGCTAKEMTDCAAYGAACVDHQCNGGYAPGTGCTAKEMQNCNAVGANCVDHQCSGGFAPGTGCTARETTDCNSVGCDCREHQCAGGFCPG